MFHVSYDMKYDFITIGGAVEDITFSTNEGVLIENHGDVLRQKLIGFEYGAKIRINGMERFPGGGANNVAVCLAKLGFKTALLANVGEDEAGKRLMSNLVENNVDTRLVKMTKGGETGFSLIVLSKSNEHIAFVYRGASNELAINKIEAQMLHYSKWIYIASLSGDWKKALDKIFSVKNAMVAWNPGGAQLAGGAGKLKRYLKKTAVLMVNKDEAIELTVSEGKYKNKSKEFLNNIENVLPILKSFGPQAVVITDGGDGAYFYDGKNSYFADSLHVPPSKVADTTGVGDAFCSTFVAGLETYQGDYKRAMKLAMKNAAGVIKTAGAQNGLLSINN